MNPQKTLQTQRTIFIVLQTKISVVFYDPYGEILSGGSESRYNYEGKEFSSVTEDYDYNFRKYNPEFGIFTQPDALIPNVYDPQSLNRYRFERNNPYKYVDPDGKVINFPIALGAAVLAGAIDFGITYYITGDLSKATTSGGITAVATGFSVATFGATSVIGGAGKIGVRYVAPTGIKLAARRAGLGIIGIGQAYVEQTLQGKSNSEIFSSPSSLTNLGISAVGNIYFGPERLGFLPGIISRSPGQFYPQTLGTPLVSEAFSLGFTSTYSNIITSILSSQNNQLFTPYIPEPTSSPNQESKSSGGNNRNFTPANGCGVIMSCE
ncbi:MAG: RHS repeat-associated core domain-containing protein [Nanoarchaeota archaeon]